MWEFHFQTWLHIPHVIADYQFWTSMIFVHTAFFLYLFCWSIFLWNYQMWHEFNILELGHRYICACSNWFLIQLKFHVKPQMEHHKAITIDLRRNLILLFVILGGLSDFISRIRTTWKVCTNQLSMSFLMSPVVEVDMLHILEMDTFEMLIA